jgi:Ca-activated chloride channel family protein
MPNFTFLNPYYLLLLLLIPCFFWCKERPKVIYFSKPEWLPKYSIWWDNSILWIVTIYTLLVLALASPFTYEAKELSTKKGRDLILTIDVSGSMAQKGFSREESEKSRYEVAKEIAKGFIKNRFNDNIGIVIFGSFSFSASPLTYDLKALLEMFDLMSDVGIAGNNTAIGDALFEAIKNLESGEAKSKVIVLLTDGKHNFGKKSPKEGVDEAKKRRIKIYTVGIGTDYDKKLLEKIAKETNAKSFFAKNSKELEEVFEEIEELEPSPIKSINYYNREDYFYPLLVMASLLLLLLIIKEEWL